MFQKDTNSKHLALQPLKSLSKAFFDFNENRRRKNVRKDNVGVLKRPGGLTDEDINIYLTLPVLKSKENENPLTLWFRRH